jgi:subtilase family serine protease
MASLRRIVSSLLLPLALGAASEPLRAVTRPQRIFTPISDGQRSEIVDSANPRALAARDLGAASGDKVLPAITLRFSMTAAQKADLDQLLADQQNPNSPLYRQWLTPESFGERFGMNDNDLAKVQAWAVSQGFKVSAVARAKNFLTLSGTVAQAQRAFGTQIDSVTLDGEEHIANVTNITLPSALASTVGVVTGLDDIRPKPRTTPIVQPNFNTGSGSHFLVPADYQKIYDVQSILSTVDGTGVTIAIVGQATVDLTNVTNFRSLSGLPAKTVTVKTYTAPTAGSNSDDAFESYLDLEWPGATAPNANLIFATSTILRPSSASVMDCARRALLVVTVPFTWTNTWRRRTLLELLLSVPRAIPVRRTVKRMDLPVRPARPQGCPSICRRRHRMRRA